MKGYKYTVNKRRANRLAYRFLGFMFLLVATLQAFTMIHGYAKHLVLTALFVTFVGAYWNLSRSDVLLEAGIFSNLYL